MNYKKGDIVLLKKGDNVTIKINRSFEYIKVGEQDTYIPLPENGFFFRNLKRQLEDYRNDLTVEMKTILKNCISKLKKKAKKLEQKIMIPEGEYIITKITNKEDSDMYGSFGKTQVCFISKIEEGKVIENKFITYFFNGNNCYTAESQCHPEIVNKGNSKNKTHNPYLGNLS